MSRTDFDHDVYIIDVGLPDGNGLDIARFLRFHEKTLAPILVVSGYQWLKTKLEGFKIWIDDYIVKPFSLHELDARIGNILQRMSHNNENRRIIQYKNISFHEHSRKIFLDDTEIVLSKREREICELFLRNTDQFITRYKLIEHLDMQGPSHTKISNSINVSICKIRKKLWADFQLKTINSEWFILES